jgi:hypothetical protein
MMRGLPSHRQPAAENKRPAFTLAAGQRLALHCRDEDQREHWLDTLCNDLHAQHQRVAVLSLHGALIGNLSAHDNILLPASWRQRDSDSELQQRLGSALLQLGYGDALTDTAAAILPSWLQRRPAQLSSEQVRVTVLARALLLEPQVLLCDEQWFVEQNPIELALLQRAETFWAAQAWLLLHVDAATALPGQAWQQHELSEWLMENVSA